MTSGRGKAANQRHWRGRCVHSTTIDWTRTWWEERPQAGEPQAVRKNPWFPASEECTRVLLQELFWNNNWGSRDSITGPGFHICLTTAFQKLLSPNSLAVIKNYPCFPKSNFIPHSPAPVETLVSKTLLILSGQRLTTLSSECRFTQ